MKKLLLTIVLIHDHKFESIEEREWLYNHILLNPREGLVLHSNDLGDSLGTVRVVAINKAKPARRPAKKR